MSDAIEWQLTTHEGNRRRQHQEFHGLPLREKLARIEQAGEVVRYFASLRVARGLPVRLSDTAARRTAGQDPPRDA